MEEEKFITLLNTLDKTIEESIRYNDWSFGKDGTIVEKRKEMVIKYAQSLAKRMEQELQKMPSKMFELPIKDIFRHTQ